MSDLMSELIQQVFVIRLNRLDKRNAFDDKLLQALHALLEEAIANSQVRVILLTANGPYFSAGADLAWMQRMREYSEEENIQDAMILARLMHTLYQCPKPTLALAQGSAFGGGVGLLAACDIAMASEEAQFCFSEVSLGLIPAVISPYVIEAIGPRAAKHLFMSGQRFTAQEAQDLQLIQYSLAPNKLWDFALSYAHRLAKLPPGAVIASKSLVRAVQGQPIDEALIHNTASLIAKRRVSEEGQQGLATFLAKDSHV